MPGSPPRSGVTRRGLLESPLFRHHPFHFLLQLVFVQVQTGQAFQQLRVVVGADIQPILSPPQALASLWRINNRGQPRHGSIALPPKPRSHRRIPVREKCFEFYRVHDRPVLQSQEGKAPAPIFRTPARLTPIEPTRPKRSICLYPPEDIQTGLLPFLRHGHAPVHPMFLDTVLPTTGVRAEAACHSKWPTRNIPYTTCLNHVPLRSKASGEKRKNASLWSPMNLGRKSLAHPGHRPRTATRVFPGKPRLRNVLNKQSLAQRLPYNRLVAVVLTSNSLHLDGNWAVLFAPVEPGHLGRGAGALDAIRSSRRPSASSGIAAMTANAVLLEA